MNVTIDIIVISEHDDNMWIKPNVKIAPDCNTMNHFYDMLKQSNNDDEFSVKCGDKIGLMNIRHIHCDNPKTNITNIQHMMKCVTSDAGETYGFMPIIDDNIISFLAAISQWSQNTNVPYTYDGCAIAAYWKYLGGEDKNLNNFAKRYQGYDDYLHYHKNKHNDNYSCNTDVMEVISCASNRKVYFFMID